MTTTIAAPTLRTALKFTVAHSGGPTARALLQQIRLRCTGHELIVSSTNALVFSRYRVPVGDCDPFDVFVKRDALEAWTKTAPGRDDTARIDARDDEVHVAVPHGQFVWPTVDQSDVDFDWPEFEHRMFTAELDTAVCPLGFTNDLLRSLPRGPRERFHLYGTTSKHCLLFAEDDSWSMAVMPLARIDREKTYTDHLTTWKD